MNSCDSCLENLSAYLDKELPEADKQAFEQHIQTCEACAGELAIMKAILSSCSELEEELPAGFEASLHKRLEEAKKEETSKKNRLVKIRLFSQIAAGFVLVIALGMVVRAGLFTRKAGSAAPQSPMMSLKSASDAQANQQEAATEMEDTAEEPISQPADHEEGKMLTAAMRSTSAPARPEPTPGSDAFMKNADMAVDEGDSAYPLKFSEALMVRVDGFDTLVRIQTADIYKALDSITAIEKKLDNGTDANCANLDDAKLNYGGEAPDQPVEVKLYYSNEVLWQQFLGEMQGVFPDMVVESVPAQGEQEYIRVVLQKAE